MTDVPRRMPPGQAQRLRVIADRDQSLRGGTRWARPVQPRPSSSGQAGSSDNPVITGETHYDTGAGRYDSVAISSTAPNEGALDNPVPATPLAHANGGNAVAIGVNANAAGDQSVALGYSPIAYQGGGIALGWSTQVYGDEAIGIGAPATVGTSTAQADGSVAIGFNAEAHGNNSVAVGPGALAGTSGTPLFAAVAIGAGASAARDYEVGLGSAAAYVVVRGGLILADSTGALWKVVVSTSGALSTVAYP